MKNLALDGRGLRVLGLADLVHELLVEAEMSETGAGLGRSRAGHLSVEKHTHRQISFTSCKERERLVVDRR